MADGDRTIACGAETMPADKYGYQPVKEVGAFGEQIKHAPPTMKLLLANAEGKTVNTADAFATVEKLKTKEEIITPPSSR